MHFIFWALCACGCVKERLPVACPWHCFCTSLVLAYLIIILFSFSHTRSLPSLRLPLNCRVVEGVTLGSGRIGVLFRCCLQFPLVVWCLVLSCQGLRIWGRTDEENVAFSTAGWEYDNEKLVDVHTRTYAVCAVYTPTQQAQFLTATQV